MIVRTCDISRSFIILRYTRNNMLLRPVSYIHEFFEYGFVGI